MPEVEDRPFFAPVVVFVVPTVSFSKSGQAANYLRRRMAKVRAGSIPALVLTGILYYPYRSG